MTNAVVDRPDAVERIADAQARAKTYLVCLAFVVVVSAATFAVLLATDAGTTKTIQFMTVITVMTFIFAVLLGSCRKSVDPVMWYLVREVDVEGRDQLFDEYDRVCAFTMSLFMSGLGVFICSFISILLLAMS